jgi:hypothetical protein
MTVIKESSLAASQQEIEAPVSLFGGKADSVHMFIKKSDVDTFDRIYEEAKVFAEHSLFDIPGMQVTTQK